MSRIEVLATLREGPNASTYKLRDGDVVFVRKMMASRGAVRKGGHRSYAAQCTVFQREAKLLDRLNRLGCPHVPRLTVMQIDPERGPMYFDTVYYAGGPIGGRETGAVTWNEPMDARRVLFIVRCVAETFDFLHRHGITYGDLHASQIVTEQPGGPIRLLDYQSHSDEIAGFETRVQDDLRRLGRLARSANVGALDGLVPYLLDENEIRTAAATVARCEQNAASGGGR